MRVNLRIASVAKETGALLTTYLQDRGLIMDRQSPIRISYGIPGEPDDFNGNCGGGDKIQRLRQMEAGLVSLVPWFQGTKIPKGFQFPALARRIAGHGGEDIAPVFQADEIRWRLEAGWSWFSTYVPVETEYRVWICRGECLGIYEKVMCRPTDYKYIGRNFRNGFDFVYREQPIKDAHHEAMKVIRALQFDFGAVDMLRGLDGRIYVLECNTAPGTIKSKSQATLAKLADRMVQWANDGCPARGY